MKSVFLLFAILVIGYFANAQTVEGIQVKSEDDKIIINYRIGGSTDAQYYNVALSCSMDGGLRFEPRTMIGDVGENIRGGRSYYTIEWDVFEDLDVDEVGDAEFFVKVDLVSDMAPVITQPQVQPQVQPQREEVRESPSANQGFDAGTPRETFERKSFFAFTGSTASPYGISFGGVKNFGGYASLRFDYYSDDWDTDIWLTATAGLTKYILTSGQYRLHIYAGIGSTYVSHEDNLSDYSETETYLTFEGGFINVIGRFNLTLGLESISENRTYMVYGVGFVF